MEPELVLHGGKITTLDAAKPEVQALAVREGMITAIGSDDEILSLAGAATVAKSPWTDPRAKGGWR